MRISYETIQAFQKVITGDSLETRGPIAPYRSGPELITFFNQFGENDYYGKDFPSRWNFTEEKIKKFNGTDKLARILETAVDPRHFLDSEFDISKAVDLINQYLEYDGFRLIKENKHYKLREIQQKDKEILIFISHSSMDITVVSNLVNLLRRALNLNSSQIRCTSLNGYKLSGGATINETLKQEIYNSKSFLGLITPNSLKSNYVLFELGARWGAKKQLIPLLAGDMKSDDLVGPLKDFHALSCDNKGELFQLISELSDFLNQEKEKTELYSKLIDDLVSVAN